MSFGARAEIRLDALRANLDRLRSAAPDAKVIAAVKANAYGHGIETVARALEDVECLGVARLSEAARLRRAGIDGSILLMSGVLDTDELGQAVTLGCDLVVHTGEQVELLESARVPPRRVWLKVDTGMRRLGVDCDAVPALAERLRNAGSVGPVGLMTHLANADDLADPASSRQFERFEKLTRGFDGDVSVANSAALLGWGDDIADPGRWGNAGEVWIRPGISLYGISPLVGKSAIELGLRPVMQFETVLLAVKPIAAGSRVGYGGTWRADTDTVLGIAAAGYGDGYSRFLPSGTPVLVNGRRVPVAGVVSMDLVALDLGPGAAASVGDPVVLWGDGLPVEEVASFAGTIPYALVTGVIDRAGRLV